MCAISQLKFMDIDGVNRNRRGANRELIFKEEGGIVDTFLI